MTASRRTFIKTVILGTGAVFTDWREVLANTPKGTLPVRTGYQHTEIARMYWEGDKKLPSPSRHASTDYVIIGGGAAGIAAAWQLKKAGKDCLLLENEAHLGGVMHNPVPGYKGINYPLGSTYFARYNGVFKELLSDLNIHPIETGEDAYCFDQKNVVVDPWNPANISQLPIAKTDQEAFRTFRDFLLALPIPTYPVSNASKEILKEYDSMSAHEFVQRFKSPVLYNFMDLYSRSVLGAPLQNVNAYSFLNFYSVEFGDAFNLPCYTMQGGLGAIAASAEQYLGMHVRPNAVAVRVANASTGVDVSYIDATTGQFVLVQAKKAIVATSKKTARKIVLGLPDDQSKAMDKLQYSPYITVALCCNAPLFDVRAFDFWQGDKHGRYTDIIDVSSSQDAVNKFHRTGVYVYMVSAPQPKFSLTGLFQPTIEERLVSVAQDIAAAVGENIPGARDKMEELHIFDWVESMVIPTVGSYQKLVPLISRPHGNIHFAHSDNDIAPGYENAVWWGVEMARRVIS